MTPCKPLQGKHSWPSSTRWHDLLVDSVVLSGLDTSENKAIMVFSERYRCPRFGLRVQWTDHFAPKIDATRRATGAHSFSGSNPMVRLSPASEHSLLSALGNRPVPASAPPLTAASTCA